MPHPYGDYPVALYYASQSILQITLYHNAALPSGVETLGHQCGIVMLPAQMQLV